MHLGVGKEKLAKGWGYNSEVQGLPSRPGPSSIMACLGFMSHSVKSQPKFGLQKNPLSERKALVFERGQITPPGWKRMDPSVLHPESRTRDRGQLIQDGIQGCQRLACHLHLESCASFPRPLGEPTRTGLEGERTCGGVKLPWSPGRRTAWRGRAHEKNHGSELSASRDRRVALRYVYQNANTRNRSKGYRWVWRLASAFRSEQCQDPLTFAATKVLTYKGLYTPNSSLSAASSYQDQLKLRKVLGPACCLVGAVTNLVAHPLPLPGPLTPKAGSGKGLVRRVGDPRLPTEVMMHRCGKRNSITAEYFSLFQS